MDKRIEKTRENIYVSFLKLLNHKSFEKITAKDIITQANIGRSTFYDHFETKDDLLEQVCRELFEHTFVERQVPSHPREMTAHIFYHFGQNKDKVKTLLLSNNVIFNRHFSRYLLSYLYPLLAQDIGKAYPQLPRTYQIHLFENSLIHTLTWWLEQGEDLSEDQVTDYFLRVILANQIPDNY